MLERDKLISDLKSICCKYGDTIGKVILFGSYARDEATDKSDIDLYIESADESITTGKLLHTKDFHSLTLDLYRFYDYKMEYDLLAYGGKRDLKDIKKSPLWEQIEKDGVVIYDNKSDEI